MLYIYFHYFPNEPLNPNIKWLKINLIIITRRKVGIKVLFGEKFPMGFLRREVTVLKGGRFVCFQNWFESSLPEKSWSSGWREDEAIFGDFAGCFVIIGSYLVYCELWRVWSLDKESWVCLHILRRDISRFKEPFNNWDRDCLFWDNFILRSLKSRIDQFPIGLRIPGSLRLGQVEIF